MSCIEYYIVFLDRKKRQPWVRRRSSPWYGGVDLPLPQYWRESLRGPIQEDERVVVAGERLELVVVVSDPVKPYYDVPRGLSRKLHILRRVRLNEDGDSYIELFQSDRYRQRKQQGDIRELERGFYRDSTSLDI